MSDSERTSQPMGEKVDSVASMESILQCVAQPVWVVDHDGLVVFVNAAALAALGFDDLSELKGRFGHDAIHYKHRDGSPYPAEDCPMTRIRGTGETIHMEEDWFVRRDGTMFPVSYTGTPLDLPDGPGVVVAFKDIEEQREAEQALREREAILAKVGQPVWVTDAAGFFHYANPAALAALGYDAVSDLVGKPAHDTVHYKYPDGTPFPEDDCPLVQARRAGRVLQDTDDWLVHKDGSIVRVTYSSAPFELPDGLGSVTAFTDVEEQRRAEAAARERDVAQARAEELRVARRRIIEAADAARAQLERDLHDGAQQQFVSALLQLQLAERKAATDPKGALALRGQAIELATTGINELRRLAAGIHPAILTDRGLGPAVEALASRLPLDVSVMSSLSVRLPAPVEASVYFFVSEALTNVVKHAEAGSATVSIAAANGDLTVEVDDDGVGGASAGAGSGLRGLGDRVAALDGTLEVESAPGAGTRLRATIPLR
jgi:PAS domain S-box-containing protein